ncbi:hypothetical protein ACJMK2_031444 [Sinanodonta woodiana]|uniref:EF-hand domain-containing protein n=1 Tax=Sinanodonta woodiana TaxID=1069815 RepID=A0ABD3X2T2_SINWO
MEGITDKTNSHNIAHEAAANMEDEGSVDETLTEAICCMDMRERTYLCQMSSFGNGLHNATSRTNRDTSATSLDIKRIYNRTHQVQTSSSNNNSDSDSVHRISDIESLRLQVEFKRQRMEPTSSVSSFDYDEDEAIQLVDVKNAILPKKRALKTDDVYLLACSMLGITPSQAYLKQVSTPSSIVRMKSCGLSRTTIKPIAVSIVRDRYVKILDVSGNDVGPLGVMFVAEMMNANTCITELDLSATNPGRDGLGALAASLKHNKTLQILRLESNNIDHTEADLIIEIIRNSATTDELYLGHNKLGYDGGTLLAKELETNTTLRVLDLQWNHFRKESGARLSYSLKTNRTLQRLNLAWNGLGKEGCIALAKSLPSNQALRELDLTNNRIDVVSLPFLLHGLVHNKHLYCIKLPMNPMTTEGAKAVLKAIMRMQHSAINEVNLEGIPVDREFMKILLELKSKKRIIVEHGEELQTGIEVEIREHNPNDLNRFDPVLVLVEYMRIDNLRIIDLFQYLDVQNREKLSLGDLRDGVATLQLPLTEYHLEVIMKTIDTKRDGYIDIEEFMNAHKEMSKTIVQRTTRARKKGKKEDIGLMELRKILKEIIEKRNKHNKERASNRKQEEESDREKVYTKKASLTVTKPKFSKPEEGKKSK